MSAPSHCYETHGLHSLPEQNQAWGPGTRFQESGYTGSLFAFIMPHYNLRSPPIIHTQQWYCSYTVCGCQSLRDVYLAARVCWRKLMFVRGKTLNVHSLYLLAFQRMRRSAESLLNYVVFHFCRLWNKIYQLLLLSGYLKYLKPRGNHNYFKTSINLNRTVFSQFRLRSWYYINLMWGLRFKSNKSRRKNNLPSYACGLTAADKSSLSFLRILQKRPLKWTSSETRLGWITACGAFRGQQKVKKSKDLCWQVARSRPGHLCLFRAASCLCFTLDLRISTSTFPW